MFLTEKRDGIVIVRACENGSFYRDWENKEQVLSPTVWL